MEEFTEITVTPLSLWPQYNFWGDYENSGQLVVHYTDICFVFLQCKF